MKSLPLIVALTAVFCSLGLARADEAPVLQGQIVDGEDHPLPGVQVFAWPMKRAYSTQLAVDPVATTVSDEQGKWKFPGIDSDRQIMTVGAWPKGYSFGGMLTGVLPGKPLPELKFAVSTPKVVHLHLVDWKNHPVLGASARFVSQSKSDLNRLLRAAWIWNLNIPGREKVVHAEPDGTLTMPFGGDGDTIGVQVTADGFQSTTVNLNVPQDDGLTVRLAPGAGLRGRLVDTAGQPLGGQKIAQLYFGDSAVTRQDGTFSFNSLDETPFYLSLATEDLVLRPKALHPSRETMADAGDIVAEPGGLISGQARDAKTGKPLDGYLTVRRANKSKAEDWPWESSVFTEDAGKFTVRVALGKYNVTFTPTSQPNVRESSQTVEVTDGQPATVNFSVDLTAKGGGPPAVGLPTPKTGERQPQAPDYIYGQVTNKDGAPVAGAQVTVYQGDQAVRDTRTGENGKYAIGPLRGDMSPGGGNVGGLAVGTANNPAPKIFVRAEAPGMAPVSVVVPLGADGPVNLRMGLSQELRLRLTDAAGQPVSGVKVSVKRLVNYIYTPDGPRPLPDPVKGPQLPAPLTSGTDGIATFQTLPSEGFCEVKLEHPDYAPFTYTVALPRLTTVELPVRKPARVLGSIHFGDEILKGTNFQVSVRSNSSNTVSETATLGGDGHFEIKNLPPTDQLADDYLTLSITPPADNKEVFPGLKLEAVRQGQNSNVYLIDTRDPNLTHRWIGYVNPVPNLQEGGTTQLDIVMQPMTRVTGKVPVTTEHPNPAELMVTFNDPRGMNSWLYTPPVSVTPDKDGKFEIWVPSGKTITLDLKPKTNMWGDALMAAVLKDPVADEDREVTFKPNPFPDMGIDPEATHSTVRVVGPDGATVPRISLRFKVGADPAIGEGNRVTSTMDGLVQLYVGRNLKGETIEFTSDYLDKPCVLKWDEKNPSQQVVLSRIPEKVGKAWNYGPYFDETDGAPAPVPVSVGDPAPDFKIEKWGRGGPVTMAALKGKTVIIVMNSFGLQSLLPIQEKRPSKVVIVVLLSPGGGDVDTAYNQMLDSAYARYGEDVRKRVDAAISVIGQDTKVANEWRGYTGLALGAGYGSAIIDPQGRVAATGLWGAQMVAKADQLSE